MGLVIRNLLGASPRTNLITLLLFAGGLFGLLSDIPLLTNWIIFGTLAPNFDLDLQASLWSVFLVVQNLGFWLSAWGFVFATIVFYMTYQLLKEKAAFTNTLKWLTLTFSCLAFLLFITMCLSLFASSFGLVVAVLFLILTVFIVPAWTLSLADAIKKHNYT